MTVYRHSQPYVRMGELQRKNVGSSKTGDGEIERRATPNTQSSEECFRVSAKLGEKPDAIIVIRENTRFVSYYI